MIRIEKTIETEIFINEYPHIRCIVKLESGEIQELVLPKHKYELLNVISSMSKQMLLYSSTVNELWRLIENYKNETIITNNF